MLLPASSPGGGHSFHDANSCLQPCRGAVGCAAAGRACKRRSDPARTTAKILVADLNRHAPAMSWACILVCDGIAHDVPTLLACPRLRAPQGVAGHPLMGGNN